MINFWTTQGAGFLLPSLASVFIGPTGPALRQSLGGDTLEKVYLDSHKNRP